MTLSDSSVIRTLRSGFVCGWRNIKGKEAYAGKNIPLVGSTKSLSGHSLGAAGVQEAIYSLVMMQGDFVAASANIENLDPEADGMPIVVERKDGAGLQRVMSNSFGFGGTNASLVFQRLS